MALIGKLRDQVDRPHCVGDLAALRHRLDGLVATVDAQREARKADRAAAREQARAARELLVVEAEQLAESTRWKASGDRFRAIVEEWRVAPHAERSYEQELWKRLSHARSTFEKRRRAWFAARDAERAEAATIKEKIVKEAEALAPSKDWGPDVGGVPLTHGPMEGCRTSHPRGRARAVDAVQGGAGHLLHRPVRGLRRA